MTDKIKNDIFYNNSNILFLAHPDNDMYCYKITKRPKITDDNIIIGHYYELYGEVDEVKKVEIEDNEEGVVEVEVEVEVVDEDKTKNKTLHEAFSGLAFQINKYYDYKFSEYYHELSGLESICGEQNVDLCKKFINLCLYKDFINIDSIDNDLIGNILNSKVLKISIIDNEILTLFNTYPTIASDNLIICSFNTTKYILNKFIFEELKHLIKKDKNIKYNLIDITKSNENITKDFGKLQSKKENNCYEKLKNIYDDLIKQYKVPQYNYYCDFYSPKNNLIIEFLGDYFHGNIQTFNSSDLNPTIKKTYKVLNEETCNKLKNIKDLKYNVCYIWENKYDTLKNNNIQTIINIYKYEEII